MITSEEIIKYQKLACYVATKRGYSELADDFAQDLLLNFVANSDRGATVDQHFVDYLRREYGDTRSACGTARSRSMRSALSLDAPGYSDEGEVGLYDRIAATQPVSESESTQRECSLLFGGREADIYKTYFVEERTQSLIAKALEITESRVSQILKSMKQEVSDYYVLREGLERMEWDPDYSKLQVDWIRL